jgi:predicted small metal-binding protein
MLKEVTCMCGWQTRGTEDEVVEAIQAHGDEVHGQRPSREEIMALAVDLAGPAEDAETA